MLTLKIFNPMPVLNGRKFSKSELILKLLDLKTRNDTVSMLQLSNFRSIPKWISQLPPSNNHRKFKIEYFRDNDDEMIIRELFKLPKSLSLKLLRSGLKLKNSSDCQSLSFDSKELEIFYHSILIFLEKEKPENSKSRNYILKLENDLILSLYNEFTRIKRIPHKLMVRFSKDALKTFMINFSWNFQIIVDFLVLISPKIEPSAIQLWFESDYMLSDKVFKRFGVMKLSDTTPFNRNLFLHLLNYNQFKKAVFNGIVSHDFLISIKDYANRPDFDYFYRKNKINRIPFDRIPPKDFLEFSFFLKSENLNYSDLIKINRYQLKIGHSPILSLWISERIDFILSMSGNPDYEKTTLQVLTATIQYNSLLIQNKNDKEAIEINNKLFEGLKDNESILRYLIGYFYSPSDIVLYKLISKDFSFEINDAFRLINQGFEEELFEYFKNQSIGSYINLIDDWSSSFFFKFFSSQIFNVEEAVYILNFLNNQMNGNQNRALQKNISLVYEIYNKICNFDSQMIFDHLPLSLKFIFCLRHSNFICNFLSLLNPDDCSLFIASKIHELLSHLPVESFDCPLNSSIYYQIACSPQITFDSENVIESIFLNNFILKQDSFYLLVEYFDSFISQVVQTFSKDDITCFAESSYSFDQYFISGSGVSRISACLQANLEFNQHRQVSFIMQFNLNDKYTLFILFDRIHQILINGSSLEKIFVLSFINSSLLSKNHILRFIDCLIPLLNSSNRVLCNLSKLKFKQIEVENKEIQNILPEVIMCFENKNYFNSFYNSFENILFNNYLCFNSVNIIIQLLFKYLDTNTKECLNILSRIVNITKDKDIKHISGLIFSNISKFVVTNNFYTTEALSVASQFCVYVKFEDFDILMKHLHSMRICNYLVGILKVKGDTELNNQIIKYVINSNTMNLDTQKIKENEVLKRVNNLETDQTKHNLIDADDSSILSDSIQNLNIYQTNIEPSFIAAACELSEFAEYLAYFIPVIKDLFKSSKIESRQIACKAMKSILSNPSHDSYKNDLNQFLIEMCISPDHNLRLSALDVIHYLPIIYILRNDNHTLVKKKAYEIWKENVSNTNKELKYIFKEILSFLKYYDSSFFLSALKLTLNEMAIKYTSYLELYLDDDTESSEFKEYILIEAANASKLIPRAISYCNSNYCPELFKILFKNQNIRDSLVENSNSEMLLEICYEDCDLALFLFNKFNDPIYIDFLSYSQKIEIIKNHHISNKVVTINDENIIFILQTIESTQEIENILIRIHPSFSYFYISVNRIVNYGMLTRIYERVFDVCNELDELINERSIQFIKGCSFERVNNKLYLLFLLIKSEDRKSFERAVEIIKLVDFKIETDQNSLFTLLGYLFRNFLSKNRRIDSEDCILKIYEQNQTKMGFFENIIQDTIVNK